MFSACGNLYIIISVTVLGIILYRSDKKRRLDQCYKYKVEKKQTEIKLKETEELRYRLLAFPKSNKMKHIKKFVIQEVYERTNNHKMK